MSGIRGNVIREDHGRAELQLLLQRLQIGGRHAVDLAPIRQQGRREGGRVVADGEAKRRVR